MSDDDWRFNADESKTGWIRNKATIGRLKLANLTRLAGLIAVILASWNFFALFVSVMPVASFFPELLLTYLPDGFNAVTSQALVAVVGAIVVWFS